MNGENGIAWGTGAGQHGVTQGVGAMGGISGGLTSIWRWFNTPFTTPLAPMDLFVAIGVVLVSLIAWNMILYHLRAAAETVLE